MQLKNAISQLSALQFIVEDLDINSVLGRRFLLESAMMYSSNEIDTELNLVEKALTNLESKSEFFSKLQIKLSQLRDIKGSIRNIGNNLVLDDVELFEIKHFSMLIQDILKLHKDYQFQLIELPSLQNIIEILDPHQTNIPSFYIYDAYSEKLSLLREKIKTCKSKAYYTEEERTKELDFLFHSAELIETEVRAELCKKIKENHPNLEAAFTKIAHLDVIVAKAFQVKKWNFCKPTNSENTTEYKSMFNPQIKQLLKLQQKDFQLVSIKLDKSVCFITGANMAGKTVVLKTVALCQYLYQFGFFIPAESAKISLVDSILLSVEEGKLTENGLSSFASEMVKVNAMVEEALKGKNVLILIDELARTTNPVEGRAIVNAVANIFFEKNVRSLITTHYSGLSVQCRKLRVKGVADVIPKENINQNTINNFIDYSLIEDEVGDAPHEALRICTLLGINQEIISKAQNELKK